MVDPRIEVRDSVIATDPVDAREAASVRAFIEFYDRLADPFNEHADLVHVTGSAIIAGPRGVVLHLHKRLHRWLQPGGHIEAGEMPWEGARREAEEETGLTVELFVADHVPELLHVDVHPGPRGHTHLDLRYLFAADDTEPSPPPGESQDVRWFAWDDAMAIADPALVGALTAGRAILRPTS